MPEILMPRLSDTMEEGTLSRWLKHEGDQIRRGDVIAEIETDKAVMELEAYDEGPLTRILVPEGATVAIGAPVAVVGGDIKTAASADSEGKRTGQAAGTQAADTGGTPDAETAAPDHAPSETEQPAAAPPEPATPAPAASGRVPTSPLARRTATQHSIDITTLTGSGPGGRVVRADVDRAVARLAGEAATAPAATEPTTTAPGAPFAPPHAEQRPPRSDDAEEVPLSTVRRITAQRLTQSTQQAPHFYLTSVIDAEPLLAFRAEINDRLSGQGLRVSVNDLIVKACAVTLRAHPAVNASWADTRILRHHRVHVGIAVALDDGLTVPVVHDADRKTLTDVARETRELAEKARAGRLSLDELTDGTFTVSNLGPYGVDHFTAVINPPQAAILAVGAAHPAPVVRHGELRAGTDMALTLSIDHRVLDGATGATFLADLKALLEQPLRIVM